VNKPLLKLWDIYQPPVRGYPETSLGKRGVLSDS
jgi:hypothetical protein